MQQLAEGTLLQPSAPRSEANAQGVPEVDQDIQDMLIQGLESFPISSCNSWGIPNLSNRMSLGVPPESWGQLGPAHEWLARIARPPAPKIEAAIPEEQQVNLPLPSAVGPEPLGMPQWQEMSLRSNSAASTAIESPVPGFLSMLRMGQTDGQFRQPGEPHQETYPFHIPGQPRVIGDAPVYTPDTKLGGRPDRGGSSEVAGGSEGAPGSAGASHEQAESQEQANGKGRRSKEDVQKRNKEAQQRFRDRQKAKLKEAEDAAEELRVKLDGVMREKAALEAQLLEFTQTLAQRDELIAQLRTGREAAGAAGECPVARFPCNVTLSVYPNQHILLTQADVIKLRREDLVAIWKEYVNALSNLLPSGHVQLSESAAQTVTVLTQEATQLMLCVADSSPAMFKNFAACKLDADSSNDYGEDSLQLWGAVTGFLQLTPKQRKELVALRVACLSTLSDVIDERNNIHAFLTAAMPAAVGARHTAAQYLKAHEGIEQLKMNLKKEHDLKVDWMTAVYCNVLEPVQVARAIVQSYPWAPDTMAVAAVVAAEGGDTEALTHLRADCSGGPGAYVQPRHNSLGSAVEGLQIQSQGSDKVKRVSTPFAQDSPPGAGSPLVTSGG
ncbi:hypothetical protein WJX75_002604 [Coccomyxa subellipsoidea]|uniref:BZIP domain-containing protein n=1 Tax=Coccomyxa subellipsoidea TaxID=248742 RepID=A0ABR2YHM9_9CHLO